MNAGRRPAVITEKAAEYLKRIGVSPDAPLFTDLETLKMLQYSHVTHVPYENLDVLSGTPIRLDTDSLFDKIVRRNRGGYCFELNGLFNALLVSMGFETQNLFARFLRGSAGGIPMRRHRVMRVFLPEGEFVTDVGTGSKAPRFPVKIEENAVSEQFGEKYRFIKNDVFGWVLQDLSETTGEFADMFAFRDETAFEVDYTAASFWCEKHPESPFAAKEMLSLKTQTGRITLDGSVFRIFDGAAVTVRELSDGEKAGVIRDYFNISI